MRVVAALAALAGLLTGYLVLAAPASAHHPNLTADVVCGPVPGTYTVNFTSGGWPGGSANQRTHDDVRILFQSPSRPGTGSTWPSTSGSQPAGSSLGATGAFNSGNGFSFSGSFDVTVPDGATSLDVIAWAAGQWGAAGSKIGGTGNELRGPESASNGTPVRLTLPTDCSDPGEPGATARVVCDVDGGAIEVTLTNTGGEDVTYTVSSPAGDGNEAFDQVVVVGPGGSTSVEVPALEDTTRTVTVTADEFSEQFTYTVDCLEPSTSIVDCAVDADGATGVEVQLVNGGSVDTTFTVDGATHPVGAGQTVSVFVPVAEGADYSIAVTAPGGLSETFAGTRDCQDPGASLVDCAVDADGVTGVEVVLTNENGLEDVVYDVDGSPVTVAPGATETVFVPVAEGADYSIAVTAPGLSTTFEGTQDCVDPGASLSEIDCDANSAVVTLTNDGELPAEFRIVVTDGDGTVVLDEEHTVDPGGEEQLTLDLEENETYRIVVTEATEDEPLVDEELSVNCLVELIELLSDGICDGDAPFLEWSITLDTAVGADPLTLRWFDADGVEQLVQEGLPLVGSTLWPGAAADEHGIGIDWPGWIQLEDGTWVEGDDGFAWARPEVSVLFEVNPDVGPVTLAYPPARPDCDARPPGDPEPEPDPDPVPDPEPPTEVGGAVVTPPQQESGGPLPRTGSDVAQMVLLALGLLLIGGGIVVASGQRRAALH